MPCHRASGHGDKNLLNDSQLRVLNKCQGKFDCLDYEMLFIKEQRQHVSGYFPKWRFFSPFAPPVHMLKAFSAKKGFLKTLYRLLALTLKVIPSVLNSLFSGFFYLIMASESVEKSCIFNHFFF